MKAILDEPNTARGRLPEHVGKKDEKTRKCWITNDQKEDRETWIDGGEESHPRRGAEMQMKRMMKEDRRKSQPAGEMVRLVMSLAISTLRVKR